MSFLLRSRLSRVALWLGLGGLAAIAAPAACFYPEYSFDEPEPTGTGGNGGQGGGNTSGGGMATTTTGGPTEDCTNGVDDNGDNMVDCEDPQCTDYVCAPEVPAGWTGYVALSDGPSGTDPGCPSAYPTTLSTGNNGLNAPPAACTCSCSAPQWGGCAALDTMVITTGDAACGQATFCSGAMSVPAGWNGSCHNPSYFPGGLLTCGPNANMTCDANTGQPCNVSVTASAIAAVNGSCTPSGVTTDKPDVEWASFGRACTGVATTGKGCNVGQTCLPRLEPPFVSGVCIAMDGDNACPPGAFTQKHVFYGGVMDDRACTDDCTCGTPSGGTCPSNVTIYSSSAQGTCQSALGTFAAGTCMNVAGNPNLAGRTATAPGAPSGGMCLGSGGTPTGTATTTNPTTFCCIP